MNSFKQSTENAFFDSSGQLHLPANAADLPIDVVWVPTQQVLLTEVQVPGKRKSDWMRALPFALEEVISQPLDEVFIAVLNRVSSGEKAGLTSVAVVDKTVIENWIEALQAAGLDKVQLVADCFQLTRPGQNSPLADSAVEQVTDAVEDTIYVQTDAGYLVRKGQWGGFWLPLSWQDAPQFTVSQWQPAEMQSLTAAEIKSFGLRQGLFQPQSQVSQLGRHGRNMAILSALVLTLWVGQNWWLASQNAAEREQVVAATEQLFQQMFPNVTRIVNIKAQTQTALARQQQPTESMGPASLALLVESSFQQAKSVKIDRFKWQNTRLVLSIKAQDNTALQQLNKRLSEQLQNKAKVTLNIQKMQPNDIAAEMVIDVS